jgi:hypothetical protein
VTESQLGTQRMTREGVAQEAYNQKSLASALSSFYIHVPWLK